VKDPRTTAIVQDQFPIDNRVSMFVFVKLRYDGDWMRKNGTTYTVETAVSRVG